MADTPSASKRLARSVACTLDDFRPAIGGDETVLGVQADDHLAGKALHASVTNSGSLTALVPMIT